MRSKLFAAAAMVVSCGSAYAAPRQTVYICDPPSEFEMSGVQGTIEQCTAAIPLLTSTADQARAQVWRGRAYQLQGNLREAVADYDAALTAVPDDRFARQWRADAYRRLGLLEEARADYEYLQLRQPATRWQVALELLGVPESEARPVPSRVVKPAPAAAAPRRETGVQVVAAETAAPLAVDGKQVIEIELPSGVRLRVGPDVDPETLELVLKTLRSP